jgi:hypothetical protein
MARVDALSTTSYPKKGTLSFWFEYSYLDTDTSNFALFDEWDDTRSHVFVRRIGANTPGDFQLALQAKAAGNYAWVGTVHAQRQKWTHVVLTWDSAARTAALIVDGTIVKEVGFMSGSTFEPVEQSFVFGNGFQGAVDEIKLYDRAMSTAEALLLP